MVKIAIYNEKGGVAKTTSAINLAGFLSRKHNKRVLCIDADMGQASLTNLLLSENMDEDSQQFIPERHWYNTEDRENYPTIEDVRKNMLPLKDAIYRSYFVTRAGYKPQYKKIDVLALSPTTKDNEELYSLNAMKKLLESIESKYDYCLIDCAPRECSLTNIFTSLADYIISPLTPDTEAFESVFRLSQNLSNKEESNNKNYDNVTYLGAFITCMPSGKAGENFRANVKDCFGSFLFDTEIRYDRSRVDNSINCSVPYAWYKVSANISKDYERLTNELLDRIDRYGKEKE